MIYIIDNGEGYSDHEIHFVESSLSANKIEDIVECINRICTYHEYKLLGIASEFYPETETIQEFLKYRTEYLTPDILSLIGMVNNTPE